MKISILIPSVISILALDVFAPNVLAHGFEGDRFFPPTIQTDDPFAVDEFSIGVSSFNNPAGEDGPKTREVDISSEFSKEIFPKFALSISGTYINLNPKGEDPSQDGFDNFSVAAKYQLLESPAHEFIFSIGAEVDLGGTGSKSLGVESYSTYTPAIYFGKGFGDLPESVKYLRPFAITGTAGYVIPSKTADPNTLEWGFALEYSLPYLQQHVEDIGLPVPLGQIIPLVEVVMETPVNRDGGPTTGTINPGFLWESKRYQIGVEAVIPINRETGPNIGMVVAVQIYIDDIFPKVFGHPIFGGEDK